ncbi:MAG: helix-turn-helix domain-containing protein [Methanococcoides sp.]|nr:helix-turn-helix domain-containing protein [Methanococcoides sp.]
MESDKLYTISEVANIFNVHPATIRCWVSEGKIKAVRVGQGWRRFKYSEIKRILDGE